MILGVQEIAASRVYRDGWLEPQMRVLPVNEAFANGYAELMKDGCDFPPPVVFFDGEKDWIGDGIHRVFAHVVVNANTLITVDLRSGSLADAMLHNIKANAAQRVGLPHTVGDRAKALRHLLTNRSDLTHQEIADAVGTTVNYARTFARRAGFRKYKSRSKRRGESKTKFRCEACGGNGYVYK